MGYGKDGYTDFQALCVDFRRCHSNSVNVALHLITSPVGIITGLCLINHAAGKEIGNWVAFFYALTMFATVPFGLSVANALFTGAAVSISHKIALGLPSLIFLQVACYFGQDFAHYLTGEPTLQSAYMKNKRWVGLMAVHVYYLVPLLLDTVIYMPFSFLSWIVAHNTAFHTTIDQEHSTDMENIRTWVLEQNPTRQTTTHWWYEKLEWPLRRNFARIADCAAIKNAFANIYSTDTFVVDRLTGMDEIYVACPKYGGNSDAVFFMRHVDGPYCLWPFCAVYRCVVALNPNAQITTHLPQVPLSAAISTGEVLGFDFNREIHYITHSPSKETNNYRICLKVHYVVYPRAFAFFGRLCGILTTEYDIWARNLFLSTIAPTTVWEWFKSMQILITTVIIAFFHQKMGINNAIYLSMFTFLAVFSNSYAAFVVGTSFVHYMMYIATYYVRGNINYYNFVRNVVLYKMIALGNLIYLYLRDFEYNPSSAWCLFIGYGISFLAFRALGLERTYFGGELGVCKFKHINQFPYGYIPHPMIVGSCIGLYGFHIGKGVRGVYPWLVPCHVLLYVLHMLQEVFDVTMHKDGSGSVSANGSGRVDDVRSNQNRRSRSRSVAPNA